MDAGRKTADAGSTGRRVAITSAAEGLVVAHGFDGVRLRDVASAAGVSIGLIQHHFASRDELLLTAMREASRRRAQEWTGLAAGAGSASSRLDALVDGAIGDDRRCVLWVETCAAATRHPDLLADVQATQLAWRSAFHQVVVDGLAAGEFPAPTAVDEVVQTLVALVDGLMLAQAVEPDSHSARSEALRSVAAVLLGQPRKRDPDGS